MAPQPAPKDGTDAGPVVLLAKLKVKPDKRTEFLAFVTALNKAEQIAKPGTLNFTLNQAPDDPNTFTWVEVYTNDAAWNAHLDFQSQTPEIAAEFASYGDFLDGSVTIDYYGNVTKATRIRFENNWEQPIEWHKPVLCFLALFPPRTLDMRVEE